MENADPLLLLVSLPLVPLGLVLGKMVSVFMPWWQHGHKFIQNSPSGEMAGTCFTFPPSTSSPPENHQVGKSDLLHAHKSHILKMPKHYLWSLEWEHSGIFSLPLPQHPSQRAAPVPPLFHPLLILCLWPGFLNGLFYLLSNNPFFARTFCGALFFPTIATFLGSTLFEEVKAIIQGYLIIQQEFMWVLPVKQVMPCNFVRPEINFEIQPLQVQSPLKRAAMGGFCFVGAKGVLKIYHKQNQYIRQCKRQILDYHLP